MSTAQIKGWPWNREKLQVICPYQWRCPVNIHATWKSKDGYLVIVNDIWTVNPHFIFDNASDVPSGDPDLEPNLPVVSLTKQPVRRLWRATIWHDIGYGNMDDPTFPFTRKQIDDFFRINLDYLCFEYTKLYYYGVRILGGIFHWIYVHF